MAVHARMAATLDEIVAEIARIRAQAKEQFDAGGRVDRPRWPALVLRTPKGWTGPHEVDGKLVEGTWRAHQVPLSETRDNAAHRAQLEQWLPLGTGRRDCSTARASFIPELRALSPHGHEADERHPPTPTAVSCCATCGCPSSPTTRWTSPSPAPAPSAPSPCWGRGCAT